MRLLIKYNIDFVSLFATFAIGIFLSKELVLNIFLPFEVHLLAWITWLWILHNTTTDNGINKNVSKILLYGEYLYTYKFIFFNYLCMTFLKITFPKVIFKKFNLLWVPVFKRMSYFGVFFFSKK